MFGSAARAHVAGKAAAIAQVRWIHRGLTVQPPHRRATRAKVKQPLYSAYRLRTGSSQRASIKFRDGTILHLNQRTDALLRSPHLTTIQKGEAEEVVSPGTDHRIQTSIAIAAAIGTEFDVRVTPGRSTFIVVEGAIQVTSPKGSVVVKTNQETSVAPGQAPTPPAPVNAGAATSWTRGIPQPATPPGQNIALDANGGQVVAYSSQAAATTSGRFRRNAVSNQPQSRWDARFLNDGRLDFGWASAQGKTTNQWLKLGFKDSQTYLVDAVVIDPAATQGRPASEDLKDFEIRVSTTGLDDAAFTTVFTGTARQSATLQLFKFPQAVPARYVELYARDNYGSTDSVTVAEFLVVSITPRKPTSGKPTATPTATPTPIASPTATAQTQPTATSTSTNYKGYRFSGLTITWTASDAEGQTATLTWTYSGQVCGSDPLAQPWTIQATYQLSAPVSLPGVQTSGTYSGTISIPAGGYRVDFGQGGFELLQVVPGSPPQMRFEVNWGANSPLVPADQVVSVPLEDNPNCP